ncbi:MAG: alcohol dehydrogenase catalytic domain-containing protein [Anaerolineae bacterium]
MIKAAFYERNETIRIGEGTQVAPGPDQVQVHVAYTGICGTDLHIYHGEMDRRVAPSQILGHEISGVVSAVGTGVTNVGPGDRVTVMPLDWCGKCPACRAGHTHICQNLKFLGIDTPGGMQSYWNVPARVVVKLPEGLSLRHAALIEPIAVACHDVRIGEVKAGEFVVVLGGGPIGALQALVAKSRGATVLVSEINSFRLELLRHLGLDAVNPNEVDLPALVEERTGTAGADAVFEVTAHPAGAAMMTKLARTRGRLVIVGIFSQPAAVDLFRVFWRELRIIGARVYEREDFEMAARLAASGELPLDALISEVYPLDELKPALDQLGQGGAVMKILMQCSEEE